MVRETRAGKRSRKEERIIKRLRFVHAGINYTLFTISKHNTGKCNHCRQDCQKYKQERKFIRQFRNIKERLNIIDARQRNLGSKHINHDTVFEKDKIL